MAETVLPLTKRQAWLLDLLFMGMSVRDYVRSLVTPFNLVAALVLSVGLPVTVLRFTHGLSATTNLTDDYPWGLWIGFDMLCGVALAAGGFVLAGTVHILHLERYERFVRPAILTAFLGYILAVLGLMMDLGRPYNIWHPMVFWQPHSVMFEVGWCVMLYNTVLFLEFLPMVCERLRFERALKILRRIMLVVIVAGIVLSTMHQSSLGGLFLMAASKLHPLWYTPYLPLFFFVSAVVAGLSMVIVESMLSHRAFHHLVADQDPAELDRLVIGLGKAASVVLLVYFLLKWIGVAKGGHWGLLLTPYGGLFLVEVMGFVLLPCVLYVVAARRQSATLTRITSVWTVLGIVLNRLNVSIIAFRWTDEVRYVPHWIEITVTITLIVVGVLAFRWIVNRMPVLCEHADHATA
ncbi:MAG TPA: Ni/Fe-hydrogenase cytochrome b subunit [Phycisphaerae bacterium]|nr:Ni/Fe-hydrogenase cytochrome b subunit [Phycisphaerae bacterium]HOJ54378.1 Ni/Fe-hydrogenase cytochrome b subunit [Phycisphaerae bacterium]HOL26849.1 Ni/Fe-hydrogenase cytochrome b subunit [Phycisphaerae bacterium]HPP20010.1 Ni/Fe-hydrogenase cytochrome b subunit [Phycisphaerae bacterium]HPU32968.1 Ni/Fe-hydrogenase cytochrome b subunit [Phycisphaerae bacterium]